MAYRSLAQAASDLERTGQLVRIDHPVDADLEMAEIHRRVQEADGPALLFTRVKGSPFPALSNLYGTYERARYLFRDTLPLVEQVVRLKGDPMAILRHPWRFRQAPFAALHGLPRHRRHAPVLYGTTRIDQLPLVKSWPDDGGAFVTLPQVVTLPPGSRRIMSSNVGMYRIQLSGNDYDLNREVGMHYQLHRGIGVHHTAYNRSDEPFRATICIGGPPAMHSRRSCPCRKDCLNSPLPACSMVTGFPITSGMVISSPTRPTSVSPVRSGRTCSSRKDLSRPFGILQPSP